MTSPAILEQNRKKLQDQQQGLSSSVGIQPLPQSGAKLDWQVQDERQQQIQAATHDIATKNVPINDTANTGLQQANQTVQNIRDVGTSETARVATQVAQRQAQVAGSAPVGTQSGVSQAMYSGQDANLAAIARAGGFQEQDIPMAISIMKAESGGNPTALNTSNRNGSTDTGIFQINSIHSSWTKNLGDLNDPVTNARAAYKIFQDAGNSWTPWATFNNGAYKKFYQQPQSYSPAPTALQPYTVSTSSGLRQAAVSTAMHAIGVPYVYGGNSLTKGVDCSGLVQQVYKTLGVTLPRTADQQSHSTLGTRTSINNLKPGDLVAWQGGIHGPNYVGHIAIYKGRDANGNVVVINAPHTGSTVRERVIKPGENVFGVALHFPGE